MMSPVAAKLARSGVRAELAAEALSAGLTVELPAGGVSMLPLLRAGDVLTIVPTRRESLRTGDVAFVPRGAGWVAHRVISTAPLETRGDSCAASDGPIAPGAVLGRVVAFRRGAVSVYLDGRAGRALSLVSRVLGPLKLKWSLRSGR
ncbi:MAG TPA: hypothetical protein VFF06_34050 [Polyangia bacterium]|nr:hypothetical protein [Polyangia bacterium]